MAKRFRSLLTRRSAIARLATPMRIFVFLLTLALCWAPFAIPIYGIGNRIDPNAASIAAMSILYIEFLVLLWQWRRRLYDDSTPFKSCGLRRQRQDIQLGLIGLAIALPGLAILFGLQVLLGWATLDWSQFSGRWILEGALVGLAVGFAEELLFRGWLLTELEADYSPAIALWASSLIFAIAHFLRPLEAILATWPQFFGLVILGLTLVWAKRASSSKLSGQRQGGRLSLPMGLHGGLVWSYYIVDVSDLIVPTERVPAWLTGFGGNPLAGILGVVLLTVMAASIRCGVTVYIQRRIRT
ncbi:MAG: lysostaphin resistance A-like protein [Thainema sp.]